MAEAGLFARQDAELRATLDREAARRAKARDGLSHKFAGSEFGTRSDPVGVTHRDVRHQSHPPHINK